MPRLRTSKNNFTAGEIAIDLYGRADLAAYSNGAARLRNVLIRPTGGVTRRPGLRHLVLLDGIAPDAVRLLGFSFNIEQSYLLVLGHESLRVFRDGAETARLAAPWSAAQLPQLTWVQSADTLFLCHPDLPPQRLTRTSHDDWQLAAFAFKQDAASGVVFAPSFKFAADSVTLQASATTGTVTLTASGPVFDAAHLGCHFRLRRKQVEITAVASPTTATALVRETLLDTAATPDWEEATFSSLRGWPVAVTLFQERLIFAGARSLPNRVWMSKTSDITNFDLGTGLDDEAVEFSLLADQVDAIRAVVAGRHLQLFTAGAEWMILGEPITPTLLRAERQTRIGMLVERNIAPRVVDGATLFLSRDGKGLRQFLYTDMDQAYSADDVALLAPHLFNQPCDLEYDPRRRLILVPMADGSLSAQTNFRAQQILAWTRLETAGSFRAVALAGGVVYCAVQRGTALALECLDDTCRSDACLHGDADAPRQSWSGLDHLAGCQVRVLADGVDRGLHLVQDGSVTLAAPATRVEIGLPFTHCITPLPPEIGGDAGAQAGPLRLIRAVFRLQETGALVVDCGQGLRPQSFSRFGATPLDAAPPLFTGDRELRGLGWVRGLDRPLWRIEQDAPLPFTLLSVTTDLKGAD